MRHCRGHARSILYLEGRASWLIWRCACRHSTTYGTKLLVLAEDFSAPSSSSGLGASREAWRCETVSLELRFVFSWLLGTLYELVRRQCGTLSPCANEPICFQQRFSFSFAGARAQLDPSVGLLPHCLQMKRSELKLLKFLCWRSSRLGTPHISPFLPQTLLKRDRLKSSDCPSSRSVLWTSLKARFSSSVDLRGQSAVNLEDDKQLPLPTRFSRSHGVSFSHKQLCAVGIRANEFATIAGSRPAGVKSEEAPDVEQRRINRAITARVVRLVTDLGHEVMSREAALKRANQAMLDLVEVDGRASPPVCKLLDYQRFKYEERRREKSLRKRQLEKRRMDDVKEVRLSSRTEERDLKMKANAARKLLQRGHRVKCSITFKPGEKERELGAVLMNQLLAQLGESAHVEAGPRTDEHRSWAIMRPKRVTPTNSSGSGEGAQEKALQATIEDEDEEHDWLEEEDNVPAENDAKNSTL